MFEAARLLGTPLGGRRIVVQTMLGTNLENFVGPSAGTQCHSRFQALRMRHPQWQVRKAACGTYNCAGMVWASRRAALPEPTDWARILREDGYRPLGPSESALIGDIVVYFKAGSDEILHVGRVCRIDRMEITGEAPEGFVRLSRVLSKVDLSCGEVVHAVNDLVLNGGELFESRFYTDRPNNG
jgi:hypothetical protein